MAYRGEDTPQHVIHFGQRLTQIFRVRPTLRDHAFYRRAAVVQRLRNGWNHMLREDFRKRWQRKGVSNGLVINAVLLNLMNEARIRRCAYGSVMGLSVEDFNAGRCAFAAVETFLYTVAIRSIFARWRYAYRAYVDYPEHIHPCSVIAIAFTQATTPTSSNTPFRA